jgi:hypothetical protein
MQTPRFNALRDLATEKGFFVEHKATRRVRGWPEASAKPYQLSRDGKHRASFATIASCMAYLERQGA